MAPLEQTGIQSAEASVQETPLWERHPLSGSTAPNSVWTHDFVHDQLANGGPLKMLYVLDENTRECQAIEVGKSLRSQNVILTLSRLMRVYGARARARPDVFD